LVAGAARRAAAPRRPGPARCQRCPSAANAARQLPNPKPKGERLQQRWGAPADGGRELSLASGRRRRRAAGWVELARAEQRGQRPRSAAGP
jgi:hypothetical protein